MPWVFGDSRAGRAVSWAILLAQASGSARDNTALWQVVTLILTFVFLAGFVLSLIADSHATDPPASVVLGDCRKAQVAASQYLFFVSTPDRRALPNVTITTAGISRQTNASGVAAFPEVGTLTEVGVEGALTVLSSDGSASPALCLGTSYYHVIWLTVGPPNGTVPSGPG